MHTKFDIYILFLHIINKNIPGKGATDLMWPVDYVFKVETYIIYLDVIISVDI